MFHLSPNGYDSVSASFEFGSFSNSTTGYQPEVDPEHLLDQMLRLKKRWEESKLFVTIDVWKGDSSLIKRGPFPKLHKSDYVEEDKAFIMAGVGIIAGKKAYDFLDEVGVILQWSDTHIPLEDQAWYHFFEDVIR